MKQKSETFLGQRAMLNGKLHEFCPYESYNSCEGCDVKHNAGCLESSHVATCCPNGKHAGIWKEVKVKKVNTIEKIYVPETTGQIESKPKTESEQGVKHDQDKPRYDLLPPNALLEAVKNLTFGARKYSPENWKKVPEARRRYFAAAQRHIWAWKMGEINDPENNIHHLAAAVVDLMFILELELMKIPDNPEKTA